ncbi:MAG: diguanylate cyclase [Propionivibrio sp.]
MNKFGKVSRLKRMLAVCVVCALLPVAAAHADQVVTAVPGKTEGQPPVFMCVDPDWWPFEAIDERGGHIGIAADLIALATSRAQLQVALYPTRSWEESVAASKAGKCQLASFINQSPERDRWLIFTEPLLVDPNVLIVREDSPPPGDLATLHGRSIAIPKESAIYERVRKEFPNLKLIGTDSEYEAFGMVSNRQADMTLRSRIIAGQNIKEKGWFNLKIASEVPGYENVLRMGVLKSRPELRDQLNRGIATITKVEREQIINRHVEIKMITDVKIDYTPVIWLAVVLVAVTVTSLCWMRRLNALNRRLQQLSVTDALTGFFNRTGLAASLQLDIDRAQRYRRPLSVVMLDLDHFKGVNDEFGHLVGDQVLVEFADLIRATVRQVDVVYRWGGEEFLIVCLETPPDQVRNLAERILECIREHRFSTQRQMTVSAGIANLVAGDTVPNLTRRADDALYQAKASGRDRICVAPDGLPVQTAAGGSGSGIVRLVWCPTYLCGDATIDRQHQDLFIHANALLAAMFSDTPLTDIAACVDRLIAEIVEHFKDEEAILAKAGFAGFERHALLHRQLVERAAELAGLFHSEKLGLGELFQFLASDVVARHMLVEDRKYFSLFRPG